MWMLDLWHSKFYTKLRFIDSDDNDSEYLLGYLIVCPRPGLFLHKNFCCLSRLLPEFCYLPICFVGIRRPHEASPKNLGVFGVPKGKCDSRQHSTQDWSKQPKFPIPQIWQCQRVPHHIWAKFSFQIGSGNLRATSLCLGFLGQISMKMWSSGIWKGNW